MVTDHLLGIFAGPETWPVRYRTDDSRIRVGVYAAVEKEDKVAVI
jgi:hypothetical protein